MQAKTHQSESGQLLSVLLKPAKKAFINQKNIDQQWDDLNYIEAPHLDIANQEYEQFEQILKNEGIKIHYLSQEKDVSMDSIYCRDAAIATDKGMILCNMGKEERKTEPKALKKTLKKLDIPILGEITEPGTIEGGDVAWINPNTLAVGHSYRTNEEGIAQLKALLKPLEVEVVVVPLPHYKGPSDVFHLMSIFSPVDYDLAVVYSPLMPIPFRQYLYRNGIQLIEVPEEEFESMACNVLALGPRKCLMMAGNPKTELALQQRGCRVITYPGSEISYKGGGGPTCLTRPLLRKNNIYR